MGAVIACMHVIIHWALSICVVLCFVSIVWDVSCVVESKLRVCPACLCAGIGLPSLTIVKHHAFAVSAVLFAALPDVHNLVGDSLPLCTLVLDPSDEILMFL